MKRQTIKQMYRSLLLAIFIAEALVPAARAQAQAEAQAEAQEEDGPGRGVARISLLNGDVTVRRGDSGDWMAAAVNAPLMVEDRVLSGANARSEVQLDYYDRIRLGGDTEIRFSELEWRKYQVQVAHGTVIFSALPGTNDQIEFATPAASLRPLSAGSYKISVREDGDVEFTVRRGEAEIFTPSGTRRLTPGRTMRLHVSQENVPEFQLSAEAPRDAFDEFSERRDSDLQRVKSYQYVSRDVSGAEDLDGAGEWVNQPQYGWSWRPYVAPGWAPYREGRWVWADDSYGWTWLSYDPWGWAPYHYGRWFCDSGSWFWYPGALWGRHYWRPGLVAFFGFGGFGAGVGFGGFGWVPLAPFESYHPWYGRHGYGGYRNNANISNIYRNARVRNGVSGVNARDFGCSSGYHNRQITPHELGRASVMRGALPFSPSRDSLRLSDRQVSGSLAVRAAQSGNAHFVSSRPAPPSNRVPFGSQGQGVRTASRGAGNAGGFNRAGTPQAGAGRGTDPGTTGGAARSAAQGGWSRMGNESGTGNNRSYSSPGSVASRSSSAAARGGWSSFGVPGAGRSSTGDAAPAVRGSAGSSTASQRGGWTSFGTPERGSATAAQPSRSGWSTGGSTNAGSAAPSRGSTSRSDGWSSGGGSGSSPSRGAWSTGGSTTGAGSAPSRGSTSRSDGWSSGGGSAPSRGAWNTGSAPSRGSSSRSDGWGSRGSSGPSYSAPSRSSAPSGGSYHQSAPAPSRSSGGGGGGGGSRGGGGGASPSHSGGGGGHSSRR